MFETVGSRIGRGKNSNRDSSAFWRTLRVATSAAALLTALGFSAFAITLMTPANAAAFQKAIAVRQVLTAPQNYYVRADGSDSNNGLANTSGGAFLTVQKAIDVVAGTLDLATYDVTINVNTGTYTGQIIYKSLTTGGGKANIVGDTTTPSNVVVSTSSDCQTVNAPVAGVWRTSGIKFTSSGGSAGSFSYPCRIELNTKNEFGACGSRGIEVGGGAVVIISGTLTVSGNITATLLRAANGYSIINCASSTFVFPNAITIGGQVVEATEMGAILAYGMTFTSSGNVTAKKFNVSNLGLINTAGGGTSYFPGGTAGTGTNPSASPYGMYE